MLRGSVESFIPFTEASRLYEIGQEMESKPENTENLVAEVDEIVDDLFNKVKLERQTSVGRALLPTAANYSDHDDLEDIELPDAPAIDDRLALPPVDEDTDTGKNAG